MKIQVFALSVINTLKDSIGVDVKLSPDVDAQNAISFEWEHGHIYWQIGVCLLTNLYIVTEVHTDINGDFGVEILCAYDTISEVLKAMKHQILALEG